MTKITGNYIAHRDAARVAGFALPDDLKLFQAAPELLDALMDLVAEYRLLQEEPITDITNIDERADRLAQSRKVLARAKSAIYDAPDPDEVEWCDEQLGV